MDMRAVGPAFFLVLIWLARSEPATHRKDHFPHSQALPGNGMRPRLRLARQMDAALPRFARQSLARSGFPGRAWKPVEGSLPLDPLDVAIDLFAQLTD